MMTVGTTIFKQCPRLYFGKKNSYEIYIILQSVEYYLQWYTVHTNFMSCLYFYYLVNPSLDICLCLQTVMHEKSVLYFSDLSTFLLLFKSLDVYFNKI